MLEKSKCIADVDGIAEDRSHRQPCKDCRKLDFAYFATVCWNVRILLCNMSDMQRDANIYLPGIRRTSSLTLITHTASPLTTTYVTSRVYSDGDDSFRSHPSLGLNYVSSPILMCSLEEHPQDFR